ncbi:PREDICTED: pentatricopeptide repeat-containing protein At2g42920, chloroplastic [Nicotiana attenuata]|uniref:Pentatricopeptide repeat-containing protein, chloroplastic n=1 Tax=Nicotiana attenuata TaxID=49451 RepID=A0A1J6IE09_NICAT|nr:PREDICTED: pentatricopeptide repeat-containing protein At2g42920, chloroplastic [Nicotiana attenuata]OIT02628.1 pentatricopeptide repeat-containing protein, chloroplastic [Nicotiana attenuata]
MPSYFCSYNPSSTSISKFISNQPYLYMLETKCTTMTDLKKIHAQLIKTGLIKDKIASSRVLAFSAKSPTGDINYANMVFTQIENPNLFIWNTIIRGFSESSTPQYAIHLFIEMLTTSEIQPQLLTYPSVFKAYTRLGLAKSGTQLHGRIIKLGLEFDTFVRNTMLHMYASCGLLVEARKLFDEDENEDVVAWNSMIMGLAKSGDIDESLRLFTKMESRNDVSWNSMISCFVRNGKWTEALDLFCIMQEEKIKPSEFTLVSILNACGHLGALEQGNWIYNYVKKNNVKLNVIVVTAIIDMYCKCANVEMAWQVFERAPNKGLSSWNSMILGLATNGFEDEAMQLFSRLQRSNLKPDSVSFIGVLTACNHSGLVDKAKYYFQLMKEEYGIEPSIKHYGCMIDILGRAGLLEEAEEIIRSMNIEPDAVIWGSLLSACRSHGNMGLARWSAQHLLELDPNESSGYVLMANMYAASGHFEKAIDERISMKEKQIEKEPGCSSVEVNGEVHEFVSGRKLDSQFHDLLYSLMH